MVKIASKAGEFIPVVGPGITYIKKAKKVTGLTDPVSAGSKGMGTMFNVCFGKTGAITVECVLWLGFSVAGGLTANPVLISAGAEFGNMVLDELLD